MSLEYELGDGSRLKHDILAETDSPSRQSEVGNESVLRFARPSGFDDQRLFAKARAEPLSDHRRVFDFEAPPLAAHLQRRIVLRAQVAADLRANRVQRIPQPLLAAFAQLIVRGFQRQVFVGEVFVDRIVHTEPGSREWGMGSWEWIMKGF